MILKKTIVTSFIVFGLTILVAQDFKESNVNSYPSVVYIKPNNNSKLACSGVLINANTVLTTATCATGSSITVLLGTHDVTNAEPNQVELISSKVIIHSNYNPITAEDNIALIKLENPAPINKFIAPVELGSVEITTPVLTTGWTNIASSDSYVPVLTESRQTIEKNSVCNTEYNTPDNSTPNIDFSTKICLKSVAELPCSIGIGSPIFQKNKLVGLWLDMAIDCSLKSVNSAIDISKYLPWIKDNQ